MGTFYDRIASRGLITKVTKLPKEATVTIRSNVVYATYEGVTINIDPKELIKQYFIGRALAANNVIPPVHVNDVNGVSNYTISSSRPGEMYRITVGPHSYSCTCMDQIIGGEMFKPVGLPHLCKHLIKVNRTFPGHQSLESSVKTLKKLDWAAPTIESLLPPKEQIQEIPY